MDKNHHTNSGRFETEPEQHQKEHYRKLFRKFILLTTFCSLGPLLLVGWGINIHYTRFAKLRMTEHLRTQVSYHKKIIELFLQEKISGLKLVARTHNRSNLLGTRLKRLFEKFNDKTRCFTDLGIIDADGNHLSYVGPYDLMDKNYSSALWFKHVMEKDVYVSDMFMGFRNEPHFIIAVTGRMHDRKWILRATIDTEVFRSLVENVKVGNSGEVLLLNRNGIFQTSPRFSGNIMQKSSYPFTGMHQGIQVRIFEQKDDAASSKNITAQTWLANPRWLLVVKQNYAEALDQVNHANFVTLLFLHLSAVIILFVILFITRYMINTIKRRDHETRQLNEQLMQAGKLASIGELSAGVAHEINNPLAIILTERQLLLDTQKMHSLAGDDFKRQFFDSMSQINTQIDRCRRITHNLLRFSRRTKSILEQIDLNAFIREVSELMERDARSNGIEISHDFDQALPMLLSDPSQLQQVFLNLFNNAIDAHAGIPYGKIHIKTGRKEKPNGVVVDFTDSGCGISEEDLGRIYDPFFTTKPVGKGTGLGLSICYSIIKQLGGNVIVQSKESVGTTFSLFLPEKPPQSLIDSIT